MNPQRLLNNSFQIRNPLCLFLSNRFGNAPQLLSQALQIQRIPPKVINDSTETNTRCIRAGTDIHQSTVDNIELTHFLRVGLVSGEEFGDGVHGTDAIIREHFVDAGFYCGNTEIADVGEVACGKVEEGFCFEEKGVEFRIDADATGVDEEFFEDGKDVLWILSCFETAEAFSKLRISVSIDV